MLQARGQRNDFLRETKEVMLIAEGSPIMAILDALFLRMASRQREVHYIAGR